MKRVFVALILSLELAGCGTYQKHAHQLFPQPEAHMGLLYFYREDQFSNYDSESYITRNDFFVGRVLAYSVLERGPRG